MSKMIQLRNVPDALHRSLKARAAMAGMSLSDYLLSEIREIAERPTLAEMRVRLHHREQVALEIDTARVLQEEREGRTLSRSSHLQPSHSQEDHRRGGHSGGNRG